MTPDCRRPLQPTVWQSLRPGEQGGLDQLWGRGLSSVDAALLGTRDLCRRYMLTGNDVPDAYLAALAIEHGATWVTSDRGFERFPSLAVEDPAG